MNELLFMDSLDPGRSIYIYGAGNVGRLLYHRLSEYGISLNSFVETSPQVATVEGVPVISVDMYLETVTEGQLIVAVSNLYLQEIKTVISQKHIEGVMILSNEVMDDMLQRQQKKDCMRNQMICQCNKWHKEDIFEEKKILLIAPHPDDEVISCGGVLVKYAPQIDVLCMNSSGVNYGEHQCAAEQIAEERMKEFYFVMEHVGVHDSWIAKIWGIPPMFKQIEAHIEDYKNKFDFSIYDIILIPGMMDGHREHRYIATYILPSILKKINYKKSLLILHYDSWAPLSHVNYIEDISQVIDKKRKLIEMYESRKEGKYWEYMSGLNKYRAMIYRYDWAEAYEVEPADIYLQSAEIIKADSNFCIE